jgi:hypothetical protein
MIITENKSKQVVRSHDFEEVNCTIDAEDMRYVASLLRNNYSNTRLAVVREVSANALDANLEAGSTRPIEIKLPTTMNPTFSVRDFGGGLSQDEVFHLYSKYGKSTKRTSNNYIGAFGIGKFAPLSYGDNFTCVSYNGGKKTSYNIFVDESDDTKIVKLHEEPSTEPSGLSIEVAIADDDKDEFREVVQKFFQFFSDDEMPKFLGVEDNFIVKREKVLESNNDSWFVLGEEGTRNYYSRNESHVIMGRVAYPLDSTAIKVENFVNNSDSSTQNILNHLLSMEGFYLRVPLGSVKLHHSREALEYNKSTQKKIVSSLLVAVKEIQEIAKEKLADSPDLWEAKRNYAKIVNALPYGLRNIFDNAFEWNGIKITSSHFDRNYQLADDLIITHSWRENDSDARNGFKVRSQKTNRAMCQDNYLFLLQDLESSHGNNLRIRTLMNEDDSLEGVYIIHAKTHSAQSELDNEWQLGKVDKKHIRYTSNVDKEKPNRSGVRKANGSRANIPLFILKQDKGHSYRNADYWEDVKENLDDITESDKSIDGKFLYIPIKNYKPSGAKEWDLDNVYNKTKQINQFLSKDDKKITLFGVRAGDVKKLDKETWVNFEEFYVDFGKKLLKKNMDKANDVHAYQTIKEIIFKDSEMNEFGRNLGALFQNRLFNMDSDHKVAQAKELWMIGSGDVDNRILCLYYEIGKDDPKWLEENFNEVISKESFKDLINEINEKYPLLKNIGEQIGTWTDLSKDNFNQNIKEYISMCDRVGGE